jgi:alkyl hydroperoxide reductase subunit D
MSIEELKSRLGDYARDISLNLDTVMTEAGAPDLTPLQVAGIALASAYATKNQDVITAVIEDTNAQLDDATRRAAKAAATIMAMNNVYYRYIHAVNDDEMRKLPAKLRMNVIGNPGIPKVDFELMSLAVSSINGCGMCMEAHTHEVIRAGLSKTGVQSTIRIAAVINALSQGVMLMEAA